MKAYNFLHKDTKCILNFLKKFHNLCLKICFSFYQKMIETFYLSHHKFSSNAVYTFRNKTSNISFKWDRVGCYSDKKNAENIEMNNYVSAHIFTKYFLRRSGVIFIFLCVCILTGKRIVILHSILLRLDIQLKCDATKV